MPNAYQPCLPEFQYTWLCRHRAPARAYDETS